MKRLSLFFACCCCFCVTIVSAQITSWEIGSPTAADVTATLIEGTLTISGTGKMKNFNPAPWLSLRSSVTTVIINEVASVENTSITALSPGWTVISVSLFGIKDSCTVTVIRPGKSSIKGTVDNAGTSDVRVNLYIKVEEAREKGETKSGIIGGYVLLATTVPNDGGTYSFDNLFSHSK